MAKSWSLVTMVIEYTGDGCTPGGTAVAARRLPDYGCTCTSLHYPCTLFQLRQLFSNLQSSSVACCCCRYGTLCTLVGVSPDDDVEGMTKAYIAMISRMLNVLKNTDGLHQSRSPTRGAKPPVSSERRRIWRCMYPLLRCARC